MIKDNPLNFRKIAVMFSLKECVLDSKDKKMDNGFVKHYQYLNINGDIVTTEILLL